MFLVPTFSYTSIRADLVYPPTPVLPSSHPPLSLPRYRLNLLATDGVHLYHPLSRHQLAKYLISRPCAPVPLPLPSIPITPPTTINNIRVSHYPHPDSPTIVMAGGHELSLSPGTVTLHTPGEPAANTQVLPYRSAWGLATHPSGVIALTTNSAAGLVLSQDAPDGQSLSPVCDLRAHVNNIPCIHFSPCGNFLASASIDFTYAVYHAATGNRLYQSGQPVTDRQQRRPLEWCWAVHWLSPEIAVPVSEGDDVWTALRDQRDSAYWDPPEGYFYAQAEKMCTFETSDPVFARACTMYHDCSPVEGPSESVPYPEEASFCFEPEIITSNSCCFVIKENKSQPGPAKPEAAKQGDRDYLMVVCREETIYLHRVHTSLGEGADATSEASVETLDALRIKPNSSNRRQVMYTNIVDVPKLNLIIVTGVNVGVVLLRILRPHPSSLFEAMGKCREISTNPILFVERVITPQNDSVIGTCVVERPSESLVTDSFELWILSQDGMIECWDLSRGEHALDLSAQK